MDIQVSGTNEQANPRIQNSIVTLIEAISAPFTEKIGRQLARSVRPNPYIRINNHPYLTIFRIDRDSHGFGPCHLFGIRMLVIHRREEACNYPRGGLDNVPQSC